MPNIVDTGLIYYIYFDILRGHLILLLSLLNT